MPVISIIGTSGVGKSFLVRQLASLDCAPCFLEGEEGVVPDKVFKNVFGGSPIQRFKWFLDRFEKIYKKANTIAKKGYTIYVDGSPLIAKAIMQYEDSKYHRQLKDMIDKLAWIKPDKTILVVAGKEKLLSMIAARGRKTEELDKAAKRAIEIQNNFLKFVKRQENVIIIDRTKLDFSKERDLRKISTIVMKN